MLTDAVIFYARKIEYKEIMIIYVVFLYMM